MKKMFVLAALAASLTSMPAFAGTVECPPTPGRITNVFLNFQQFDDDNLIGIQVLGDDGATRYYTTKGYSALPQLPTDALLKLATAAMLAQTRIVAQVRGGECQTRTFSGYGTPWYFQWTGLNVASR